MHSALLILFSFKCPIQVPGTARVIQEEVLHDLATPSVLHGTGGTGAAAGSS